MHSWPCSTPPSDPAAGLTIVLPAIHLPPALHPMLAAATSKTTAAPLRNLRTVALKQFYRTSSFFHSVSTPPYPSLVFILSVTVGTFLPGAAGTLLNKKEEAS